MIVCEHEQFIQQEITPEVYRAEKTVLNGELDRLRQVHAATAVQAQRMQMDKATRNARTELAREITGASGLTLDRPGLLMFHSATGGYAPDTKHLGEGEAQMRDKVYIAADLNNVE